MATDIGQAFVQIVPSARGIKGSIEGVLGGEADSAGKSAGLKIGGALKKAIAAAGVGVAIKKSLDAGGALQQSFGGLDTLYGDAAEAAKNYANEAYKAGISANSYAEQAVSFGASLKQAFGGDSTAAMEAANTAIMDMADNAAKMGTPIESIQQAYQGFAKQNYTMLDNLKLGYGGTKTEMERLLADAEELTGKEYNIDNLGDVYDAIHAVQGELGLTGVAADEAATTFTGSLGAMKSSLENLGASLMLGENVGPSMQAFVESAVTFLAGNLLPAIGNIVSNLPLAISTAIQTGVPLIIEQGKNLVSSLSTAIVTNGPELAASAASAIESFANYISENLPNIAAKGGELIGSLAQGIITHLPEIVGAIAKVGAFILKNISKISISMLRAGFNILKGLVSGIKSGIGSLLGRAMTSIKEAMTKPIESAKSTIKGIVDKIKGFFPLSVGRIFSNLRIPRINISGGKAPFGIGGLGTKPSISVTWHAKAMENPYLFSNATLFGAGETGDEMLYGRAALMRDIKEATSKGGGGVVVNLNYDASDDANDLLRGLVRGVKRYRMAGVI